MHEMSLAEGIVQLLEEHAHTQQFRRVKQIWLQVGELAGVEPEALTFCLDVVLRGSLADGAQVHLLREPGRGWCLACSQEVPIHARFDACPCCGRHQVQVTGGEELRVAELEVE